MQIRRSDERGFADHGWLRSYHTFSFADYHDPKHMGFRALRVINDDVVGPGGGFPTHPHKDMEIITYVLSGVLGHQDTMGNAALIRPGEVQRMSAGTGIAHSELNPSRREPVHLLQIWIMPERRGLTPSYEQKAFAPADRQGRLKLVASHDGRDGSVTVHQDVNLYATLLDGERVEHVVAPGRHAWIHVARGAAEVAGQKLAAGDAVAVSEPGAVALTGTGAELLVFDLA